MITHLISLKAATISFVTQWTTTMHMHMGDMQGYFNKVQKIISKKLFPLVLGGEHSITSGSIRPFVKKHKNT